MNVSRQADRPPDPTTVVHPQLVMRHVELRRVAANPVSAGLHCAPIMHIM